MKCLQRTFLIGFIPRRLLPLCCYGDCLHARTITFGPAYIRSSPPVTVVHSTSTCSYKNTFSGAGFGRHYHDLWKPLRSTSKPGCATTGVRSFGKQSQSETIFALSSGQGKCGVAVIRVSGPKAAEALMSFTKMSSLPETKRLHLTRLYCPLTGETLDKGLSVWFSGPDSFSGEDVVEFYVHGGPAVVSAMLASLDVIEGLRHAEPGEFSKRAFLNGKLDLTEVEGLGDLIHAETEAQRRQALRQMEGDLGKLYEAWRTQLIKCVAHVEAYIDFSEDENIEDGVLDEARAGVSNLLRNIRAHLSDNRCGERLRSGVQVAIVGPPNVGKSSLLNLLCQRPAAIVTPIAGTTRDVIESAVNIGGYPVVLLDTAGLRETQDAVEEEGVRRARQSAKEADLTIVMVDVNSHVFTSLPAGSCHTNSSAILEGVLGDAASVDGEFEKSTIVVVNKLDLLDGASSTVIRNSNDEGDSERRQNICVISCKSTEGIEHFLEILKRNVSALCGNPLAGHPSLTKARHRSNLMQCILSLEAFSHQHDLVMAAEHLRIALRHLGKITGRVGVEEILDVVFQDFCIGK